MNKFVDETLKHKPVLTKEELAYLDLPEGVEPLLVASRRDTGPHCDEQFILMNPVVKKIDDKFLEDEKIVFVNVRSNAGDGGVKPSMGRVRNIPGLQGLLVDWKKTEARKEKQENPKPKHVQQNGYIPQTMFNQAVDFSSSNEEIIEQLKLATVYGNLPVYLMNLIGAAVSRLEDFQVEFGAPNMTQEEMDALGQFPNSLNIYTNHHKPVYRMVKILGAEVTSYFSGAPNNCSGLDDKTLVIKTDQNGEILSREIKPTKELKELLTHPNFGYNTNTW